MAKKSGAVNFFKTILQGTARETPGRGRKDTSLPTGDHRAWVVALTPGC